MKDICQPRIASTTILGGYFNLLQAHCLSFYIFNVQRNKVGIKHTIFGTRLQLLDYDRLSLLKLSQNTFCFIIDIFSKIILVFIKY